MKTCGTCKSWFCKSDNGENKTFGRCIDERVLKASYVSTMKCANEIAELISDCPTLDHRLIKILNVISENAEVYFEETTFGCIYWAEFLP